MACGGYLRIVGASEKERHDKNNGDSRLSVTMVRCGSAGGDNGPVVFLAQGEKMECSALSDENLVRIYGLPVGSTVIMTESGYMTDKAWMETVEKIAPGMRETPVSDFPFVLHLLEKLLTY